MIPTLFLILCLVILIGVFPLRAWAGDIGSDEPEHPER